MAPTKQEDIEFVGSLVADVQRWMSESEEPSLMLSEMNSYRRLLAFQVTRVEVGILG